MSLPNELIDEILCRLPVKPVLRFRCVSKGWCSLIDSNVFVKKHLKKTLECNIGGGLIIKGGGGNFYLADFDSLDDASASAVQIDDPIKNLLVDSKFVGASNGLICVCQKQMNDVFLFNPATKKSRKIANSPPHEFPTSFSQFEDYMCGFGYDQINDDYKVVKIAVCYSSRFRGITAFVYSLKTNAWTRIQNIPSNIRFDSNIGIFASGSVHWMASKSPDIADNIILGFDLQLQQFKEVPFPPITRALVNFNWKCLLGVGECLCFTDNYPNSSMDVWLMKEYGAQNTWYKAFTVEQRSTFGSFKSFRPLAFSKSHSNVLLLEVDGKKLLWYDPDRKTVKKVRVRGIPVKCSSFYYTESLLQLTEDKPLQKKPSKDKKEKNQATRRDGFLSKGFNLRL
ncbi:F-box protein CPR30 [Heracleum sosnowskyi]|uniref:F-box protein CPR30 n=1 Tax=Heracleum sosnowskyi TaxID=360622 RepID=A0AAD8HL11_9APIA|nr:F-box protein CPR30 [Heracleum sosnowskyi]